MCLIFGTVTCALKGAIFYLRRTTAGKGAGKAAHIPDDERLLNERKNLTRESLLQILTESDWNKAEVSRRIGYSRASVWKYMKKWDIPL